MWEEHITVVVPYTVWDELDYRSKEIDDEHQRYKARRAARMLNDELLRVQQEQKLRQGDHGSAKAALASVRSQSRAASHRATEAFVAAPQPIPTRTNRASSLIYAYNNDDRVLACALSEKERFESEANGVGGGVVP